jgi:Tfp pilus assembly protein PilX
MKPIRVRPIFPRRRGTARDEAGVVMLFVLLVGVLIGVVTVGVMQVISADLATGIRQLQAVRVFNTTEAGVHYALGKLQTTGADAYAGETITISDGTNTIGTAVIRITCIDDPGTGSPTVPCPGAYSVYRRIISTGTLTVGGPKRTIVAVVQGVPGASAFGYCAFTSVTLNQGITLYGDVGSNGSISVQGPKSNPAKILGDPNTPRKFAGIARAVGAISCSQGCKTQVPGGAQANVPGPICPPVTVGVFAPGTTNMNVGSSGWTMNSTTGYSWGDITVAPGTLPSGASCGSYTDLKIQADPTDPTAVTVVNVRTLNMGSCTRLIILGVGKVDLRVGATTGSALFAGQASRFGILPATDPTNPLGPVPASRLLVEVQASVDFNQASLIAGTFLVPTGTFQTDRSTTTGNMYGSVIANVISSDQGMAYQYDPSATTWQYTNFNFSTLRSWKDQ